jgi:hypothetical protein
VFPGPLDVLTKYTLDADKCFRFLFYQSFRSKYKSGGKRRAGAQTAHGFDPNDYDRVLTQFTAFSREADSGAREGCPDPENPVGHDLICTYKAVLYNIWGMQASRGANSYAWGLVYTHDCKGLVDMVKKRKERIRRANYAEKLDKDFSPFISMSQVDDIENAFWEHGKSNARQSFPGIRNRFVFLQCYAAVLRHESMFLGELSDMFGFEHKRPKDPDPLYIMVMQIATGKFLLLLVCLV